MNKYTAFLCAAFTFSSPLLADSQPVTFVTDDGIEIAATYSELETVGARLPAVIFIHQGGSNKSEWTNLGLFHKLATQNMIALAYDIRGHGASAGKADFSTLFNDPNQAPLDLKAAMKFLATKPHVDMDRIAIVGASIGSNLAVMASGLNSYNIKSAVAISGKTSAVYNLAGKKPGDITFRSIFHIAAANEQGGKRAAWAKEMYGKTTAPKKLEIIKGSNKHGVSIFTDAPMLADHILAWLLETL